MLNLEIFHKKINIKNVLLLIGYINGIKKERTSVKKMSLKNTVQKVGHIITTYQKLSKILLYLNFLFVNRQ